MLLFMQLMVSAYQKPSVIRLGGLYAISSTVEHSEYVASKVSLELINKDPKLLAGTRLEVSYADVTALRTMQNTSAVVDMQRLMEDVYAMIIQDLLSECNTTNTVFAFVGPSWSSDCVLIQPILQSHNMFALSYSASSPQLSNKQAFPDIGRICFSDSVQAVALAELIQYFGWQHVQVVACDGSFCQGLQAEFLSVIEQEKYREILVETTPKQWHFGDDQSTQDVLMEMHGNCSAPRVLLLLLQADQAQTLFTIAKSAGVYDDFVWVGCDAVTSVFKNLPAGYLGLNIEINSTSEAYIELDDYWKGLDPAKYPGYDMLQFDPYLSLSHDVMFTYALAFDGLLSRGGDMRNVSDLIRSLRTVDYMGASGRIQLDENLEIKNGR